MSNSKPLDKYASYHLTSPDDELANKMAVSKQVVGKLDKNNIKTLIAFAKS
jgi:hypothetical protein